MLHLLRNNLNRGLEDIRLYEIGKVYERNPFHTQRGSLRTPEGAVRETAVLTLGACGSGSPAFWAERARACDFFDLKGEIEAVLGSFDVQQLYFDALVPAHFHPGRSARAVVNGMTVATFGQLHPEIAAEWKLKSEIWLAEILLERLERMGARPVQYRPPSRFPSSERDFSFQFADGVKWEQIQAALLGLHLESLTGLIPLEVFRGGPIPAGQYNLLLRARFQRSDRTLREDEVQAGAMAIMAALQGLGGQQR
jgi:phenylalanyl-tRNA synthetase beta chain